jgi:hypothetical protein
MDRIHRKSPRAKRRGLFPRLTAESYAELAAESVIRPAARDGIPLIVIAVSPDGDCFIRSNIPGQSDVLSVLHAATVTAKFSDVMGKKPLPPSV